MGHDKVSSDEHTHTLSAADERKAMVSVAHSHLVSGKRHLLLQQIPQAADDLATACDLYATRFGELADELATPHLYYGKALLEMGRIENGVLGNAVKQGSALSDGKDDVETTDESSTTGCGVIIEETVEDMSPKERAALRREIEDAMGKNNIYEQRMREMVLADMEPGNDIPYTVTEDELVSQDEASQDEADDNSEGITGTKSRPKWLIGGLLITDDEMSQDDASQGDVSQDDVSQDEVSQDESECITEKLAAVEDEHVHNCESIPDEDSNLEHAWKILEVAAIIFKRQGDVAGLKLAETKITLAHVSMETEQYEQAAEDFMAALELQKKFLKIDDRRIAETLYHIGLAHSFNNNFPEAVTWYKKSRDSLQLRIANLEEAKRLRMAEEHGEDHKSGEVERMEAERRELKDLVVLDMNSKIEDVQNSMKFYFASNANKHQSNGNGSFDAPSDSFKPANEIVATKLSEKRKSESDESNDLKKKPHLIEDAGMDQIMEVSRPCEAQG